MTTLEHEIQYAVYEHVLLPRIKQLSETQKLNFLKKYPRPDVLSIDTMRKACELCDKAIQRNKG